MSTATGAEEVVTASASAYYLAEGPVWDARRSRVMWVDVQDGQILSASLLGDGTLSVEETVQLAGSVGAVAISAEGEWVIASSDRLLLRDTREQVTAGPIILPANAARRLNDGKPDPAGRFVVGSLSRAAGSSSEVLVAIEADGSVRIIDDDLRLSNGLAWSTDGLTFYSVDTLRRVIFRREYNPATGETGTREILVSFERGFPDGITIDAEDHLWVAMWGTGEVRRYSPKGRLTETITVPAPHVSSLAFVGTGLDTLVITTALEDLTGEQRRRYPSSGHLFTLKPAVGGITLPLWSGSAHFPIS